ncbi:MAG TPA: T9SS type A sorting domain-containing protein, partial [Candidatus Kapabacteria bacterium]
EIRRCDNDILVYSSQVVVPLLTYDSSSKEVSFPVNGIIGTTTLSPGCYTMILYTAPIANSDPSNNFASSSLIIYDKTDNNIKATSIVSPMNNSVSYGKFKVLASYTSTGLNDQNNVMVTTMIKDPSQNIVYRDTAFIANARTAFSDTVAFRPFTPLTNGKFTVYSISHLTNDETTMDDTLISTFEQDRHASIHISYIPYPTVNDTLLKGNEFICRGEFWLLGDSISQLYSVPVRVLLYRVDNGRLVFQADTIIDVFLVDGKVNTISFPSRQGSYNTAGIKGGEHIVCMMSMLNTNPLPHDSTCGLFTILPIESSAAPLQEQYNKNITVENFPNPFSTTTTLSYEVASAGYVTMRILDVAGVNLETVMSDVFVSEGKHEVALDGSHLPSGTYFVEMVVTNSEGMLARKIQPITVRR